MDPLSNNSLGSDRVANIVVVDDAKDICQMVKMALERDGHQVKMIINPNDLSTNMIKFADLILLDVMLPGEDGFSICNRIRKETDCPILFLTAKVDEEDIITGLSIGGDDYITKPFRIAQLRARVGAHLRRESRTPTHRIKRGNLTFDLQEKAAYYNNEKIPLTKSEYSICELLASHPKQVYSKEQIYETIFGMDGDSELTAITEHIKNLRAKLKVFLEMPIETVWGVGYKWKDEDL